LFKVDWGDIQALLPGGPLAGATPLARRKLLSEAEIEARLKEVPRWSRDGKSIARTWKFQDFPEALRFINRVGELAESMDHHPDIYNSWATVRLTLTTHDKGGLTDLDFDLAKKIDAL
jgi:4a-hydroxytetrahydrobiopterin dehydratase